jgi:hypothetical protein
LGEEFGVGHTHAIPAAGENPRRRNTFRPPRRQ